MLLPKCLSYKREKLECTRDIPSWLEPEDWPLASKKNNSKMFTKPQKFCWDLVTTPTVNFSLCWIPYLWLLQRSCSQEHCSKLTVVKSVSLLQKRPNVTAQMSSAELDLRHNTLSAEAGLITFSMSQIWRPYLLSLDIILKGLLYSLPDVYLVCFCLLIISITFCSFNDFSHKLLGISVSDT